MQSTTLVSILFHQLRAQKFERKKRIVLAIPVPANIEIFLRSGNEEVAPRSEPKSHICEGNLPGNSPESSFELPDKGNTWVTNGCWGVVPAVNPNQTSIASRLVRAQHNHSDENICDETGIDLLST